MRIIVSGGGTAGHISPILATSDALKSLDSSVELLYVGQANSMEARIATAAGFDFAPIQAGKFRRLPSDSRLRQIFNFSTLGLNARDTARVIAGVAASLSILRKFKPDVIFIKGGYVGLPVGLAAHILRIPYVVHESDVVPGMTNKILSRWAVKIAVGFPVKSYHEFDERRLVFTGNPVRPELLKAHRLEGLAAFKLDDKRPVILVTGGSQGAAAINDSIVNALPELLRDYQILHLTGEKEYPRIEFELSRFDPKIPHIERYHPFAFLMDTMGQAFACADLVIARAGANTIAELAALAKPTILIPNIGMAAHQMENGRLLARAGAVRILDENNLTPAMLVGEVNRILRSETEQASLSKNIAKFAEADAPRKLAEEIYEAGKGKHHE